MTAPRMNAAKAIALEQTVAAPNYAPLPVVLESGQGEWLMDVDGRRYLDMMSAYSAVSHGPCAPAPGRQAGRAGTGGRGHLARVPHRNAGTLPAEDR